MMQSGVYELFRSEMLAKEEKEGEKVGPRFRSASWVVCVCLSVVGAALEIVPLVPLALLRAPALIAPLGVLCFFAFFPHCFIIGATLRDVKAIL